MKLSIYALALASCMILAGSASAQMVNGVAGANQPGMAPVGTKAPSSGDMSANGSGSMSSGSMSSGNTAMNSNGMKMKKSKKMKSSMSAGMSDSGMSNSGMASSGSPKLVNGVSGGASNGMAPVGTKAQGTGQ